MHIYMNDTMDWVRELSYLVTDGVISDGRKPRIYTYISSSGSKYVQYLAVYRDIDGLI